MASQVLLSLTAMCAWCFLSGFVMTVVGAEPTATAWIVTPERDWKIGGRVEMRCVARNLEADHTVEWRTGNPINSLRWGNVTLTAGTNLRFMFHTKQTGTMEITQEFNITDLQPSDTDEYVCNVREPKPTGGHTILATSRIRLTVYPSSESFPICSPDGPVTANTGTQLSMRCSTDTGSPGISISTISDTSNTYNWMTSVTNDTLFSPLDLTLDASHDNLTFKCSIQSVTYPGLHHSCLIGPVTVVTATELSTSNDRSTPCPSTNGVKQTTVNMDEKPDHSTTSSGMDPDSEVSVSPQTSSGLSSSTVPWIAVSVVAIILLVVSCIVIICFILYVLKLRRLIHSLTEKPSAQVPQAGPYMELQPTDDSHTAYKDLTTTGSTSQQHTYCNTLDTENDKTSHDYEQPEDKYEAVGVSKKDENKLQIIKH